MIVITEVAPPKEMQGHAKSDTSSTTRKQSFGFVSENVSDSAEIAQGSRHNISENRVSDTRFGFKGGTN